VTASNEGLYFRFERFFVSIPDAFADHIAAHNVANPASIIDAFDSHKIQAKSFMG
jgi:hypothetical protein